MDDANEDQDPVSRQIPHARTPKGGFTDGRRQQHVRGEIQRSVRQYPERPPETLDNADREIDAAIREGRPISLERAFPHAGEHPRSTKRRNLPSGFEDAPVHPGASFDEPKTGMAPSVAAHYSEYTKEYRFALVHRLYLRGLPLGQIGAMLGITIRQVQSIRTELFERLRDEAEHADIMLIVGETLAFYDTIRNMSMKIASESTDASEKLEAMRTALSAEADKHRFLQAFGFYDNAKYVPQTSTEDDEA